MRKLAPRAFLAVPITSHRQTYGVLVAYFFAGARLQPEGDPAPLDPGRPGGDHRRERPPVRGDAGPRAGGHPAGARPHAPERGQPRPLPDARSGRHAARGPRRAGGGVRRRRGPGEPDRRERGGAQRGAMARRRRTAPTSASAREAASPSWSGTPGSPWCCATSATAGTSSTPRTSPTGSGRWRPFRSSGKAAGSWASSSSITRPRRASRPAKSTCSRPTPASWPPRSRTLSSTRKRRASGPGSG